MIRTTRPRLSGARHTAVNARLQRRILGILAAVALGISAVSGCAAGQIAQSVDQVPNHDGGHGTVGPIGVHNALIAAPENADGAVAYPSGSSSVPLIFWVTNDADKTDTLTQVTTDAGSVALDGNADITDQSALQVSTDTPVTATISQTSKALKYGFPATVEFHFANAGTLTIQVPVAIPAERETGRATTDIYPAEETNVWGDAN